MVQEKIDATAMSEEAWSTAVAEKMKGKGLTVQQGSSRAPQRRLNLGLFGRGRGSASSSSGTASADESCLLPLFGGLEDLERAHERVVNTHHRA